MKNRKGLIFPILLALLFTACGPTANFNYNVAEEIAPSGVAFDNQSEKATDYEWDFGDGCTSKEASPNYTYTSGGNYTVKLTAKKGKKEEIITKNISIGSPKTATVLIRTDYGDMVFELFDETPEHQDNFIKLAEEGFYNDLLFHRVIGGFMVQGGDPDSKDAPAGKALGMGGPGYQLPAEISDDFVHTKGALCAARTNNPEKKSSGSQFYIVQGQKVPPATLARIAAQNDRRYTPEQRKTYEEMGGTPHLDGLYTVFGRMVRGFDVLDKIAKAKTDGRDRPTDDIKMKVMVVR